MVHSKIESEEFVDYKLIMDHLPVGISITNKTGHIHWANKKQLKSFKAPDLASIRGLHISTWHHSLWDNLQEVLINRSEITVEENYNDLCFLTTRKPILRENTVVGVLRISFDVTQQKTEEVTTEFLKSIHHDIRTPLSGIVGTSQLLKIYTEDTEMHALIDNITISSEALLKILDKMFVFIEDFSTDSAKDSRTFSLKLLLESVLNLHLSKASAKGLSLLLEYDPKFPSTIISKEMHIQRLVWELLSNALKYTHMGYIKIIVRYAPNMKAPPVLELSIEDTGIGIAPEHHKAIFDPFTRLSFSWTGKETGQGIGLANVQKIIHSLGAKIQLRSAPGKGSQFTCLVPFQPAP